jgi:hypothetical protein
VSKKREQVGVIGVDAGVVMVGDPCYHVGKTTAPKDFCRSWSEFCQTKLQKDGKCLDTAQLNFDMGHEGLAVVVGGFGGDGCYPVFVKRNKDGLVSQLIIEFGND